MKRSRFLILPALFVLVSALTAQVQAAVFTVTKIADTNDGICNADCSLREAIAAANAAAGGDTIEFASPLFNTAQVIALGGTQLDIMNNGSLTINGPGANLLTISGNNASRVFVFNELTAVVNRIKISEGTINGNGSGAGLVNSFGNLTINDSVITNNSASTQGLSNYGGGIYNRGVLTLNNTVVSDNHVGSEGGAIANGTGGDSGAVLNINDSTVTGNSAVGHGGAILNYYDCTVNITDSTIADNGSNGFGGAIFSQGKLHLSGAIISNNSATQSGGGIASGNRAALTIGQSTISGNSANNGGGISASGDFGGSMNIAGSSITSNTSRNNGGGIQSFRLNITLSNSKVSGNTAVSGGGIHHDGNPFIIDSTTIDGNRSGSNGAGVFLGAGTMNLNNSTVYGNSQTNGTGEGGAGVYVSGATLNVTNSTINSNQTNKQGGGIFNRGTVNLVHATINNNRADANGGGIYNFDSRTVNARGTIIADNMSAAAPSFPDFSGVLSSQGHNLIENTSGATISGSATGNIYGQDPQLLPLRNNSNAGSLATVALQPTSPAIDAANPNDFPATDQRGFPRPRDGDFNGTARPDIGAYERQLTFFAVTKASDTNDGVCDADCSLREAIAATNGPLVMDNAIVFDASVFASARVVTLSLGELKAANWGTLAIYGRGSDLLTVSGNNQSRVFLVSDASSLLIQGLTVTGGRQLNSDVSGLGGGIYNASGFLSVVDAVIAGNSAGYGGGLYSGQNSGTDRLYVAGSVIRNNSATNDGGGAVVKGIRGVFVNSIVSGNSAGDNGGGINSSGVWENLTFSNSKINNNAAGNSGGGFYLGFNGVALISDSTVAANTSGAGGGGIFSNYSVNLLRSTVSGNSAQGPGGGILNEINASLNAVNATVSGNFGGVHGGGVFNYQFSRLAFENSTIANNRTNGIGGGVFNSLNGTVSARNTIFADNTAAIQSPDFERVLMSEGYNLIENTAGATIEGNTTGNIVGQDPYLLPLGNYGGATQTHALRLTSRALDKGGSSPAVTTDQRGLNRVFDFPLIANAAGGNGTDIGAYERQTADVTPAAPFDFDGDGKTDISIFRPSVGEWWINRSSDAAGYALQFGSATDELVPADYTGDGKTDIAFFRPASGEWFVLRSEDNSFYSFPFGAGGDIPAPADYDRDGKTDAAVFRPSDATWYIRRSSDGGATIQQFGQNGDVPVVGDYDADGKTDLAIYRPSAGEWWIQRTEAGLIAFQFGNSSDKPVQGDYTGDGKADVALFRPNTGEWFVLRSENQSYYSFPFGTGGDAPAPGDYDGDGRLDATVFRPSTSTWYSQRTSAGTLIQSFGQAGDTPVPNAFVP